MSVLPAGYSSRQFELSLSTDTDRAADDLGEDEPQQSAVIACTQAQSLQSAVHEKIPVLLANKSLFFFFCTKFTWLFIFIS
jgi:hypothetical protein